MMLLTYQDFKKKYNGKYIDFDGYYGSQCRLGLGTILYGRGT